MGHFVQAFVGPRIVLDLVQRRYSASLVIALSQDLWLLPMLDDLYDAIPNEGSTDSIGEHFQFLTPKVIALLKDFSQTNAVAYFETEYFGGTGNQGAVLAKNGQIIFGPQNGDGTINDMLRMMGVQKGQAFDEFEVVGLGRCRSNEEWLRQ